MHDRDGWSFVFYMCCKEKDAETGVRKAKVNFIHQLPSAYFFFSASVSRRFALLYILYERMTKMGHLWLDPASINSLIKTIH